MARFHEEEYKGVVIKLPQFFIDINGLESLLKEFTEKLEENSTLSLMLPDYERTLFELKNYSLKEDFRKRESEESERKRESIRRHREPRVNKDIFDLQWVETRVCLGDFSEVEIFGKSFDYRSILTKKGNISVSKLKEVNEWFYS